MTMSKQQRAAFIAEVSQVVVAALTPTVLAGVAAPSPKRQPLQPRKAQARRARAVPVVSVDLTVCNTTLAYALHAEQPEAYRVVVSRRGRTHFYGEQRVLLASRKARKAELALRTGAAVEGVSRR